MQEFTVLKMHLFPCVIQHVSQGLLIVRSRLQRGISRSHDCEKMFQVFQTLTSAWNNSTKAFASGSSASGHSDVSVRFFESDTRVLERAGFRVHSTWVSGNSTRLHADFTPVVILSVSVRLVSKFLFRCPGKSDFRSRQVTSTQCTQFTLERLDLAFHGGQCDGIDLTTFSHSDYQEITLTATLKWYATASTATQNRLSRPHLNAAPSIHPLRRCAQRPGSSSRHQSCQLHHLIITPSPLL